MAVNGLVHTSTISLWSSTMEDDDFQMLPTPKRQKRIGEDELQVGYCMLIFWLCWHNNYALVASRVQALAEKAVKTTQS